MEYMIARAQNPTELEGQVTDLMKDGWRPAGGIAMSHEPVKWGSGEMLVVWLAQAMTRPQEQFVREKVDGEWIKKSMGRFEA